LTRRLTREKIDPDSVVSAVQDPLCGGTVLFVGTVREKSEAGNVDRIHYEAYEPMAEKMLRQIEEEISTKWPESKVKLAHRVGELEVGEVSVAVAVSAPHRAEAFEGCRLAIERIKHEVPIWKKERLVGGREVWVEGHRADARSAGKSRKERSR
jgi:molybdopterin synthase catalytic subunit